MIHLTFGGFGAGTLNLFREQLNITKKDTLLYPDLALQAGEISEPFDMKLRKKVYQSLYTCCYTEERELMKNACEILQNCDEFTIWYSSLWPDDLLSMMLFVHLYKQKRIYLQDMSYAGLNLAHIQDLETIELHEAVELTAERKEVISKEWISLVNEHTNLRVLSEGRIISVPDNYYDEEILAEIGEEEVKVAQLASKFCQRHYCYCVSFMYRMMNYIRNGTLTVTKKDDITYTSYYVRRR